jgi:hypothetical protein
VGVVVHGLPQVLVFPVVFVAAEEAIPQFLAAVATKLVELVQFLFHAGEEPPEEKGAHSGEHPNQGDQSTCVFPQVVKGHILITLILFTKN